MPCLPPKKKFKSKNNLPKLPTYRSDPGDIFWGKCPSLSWEDAKGIGSSIDADLLEEMARHTNFPNNDLLRQILRDIRSGARLGVAQGLDEPSDSTNAPSSFEFGQQVTDAICQMVEEKYVMGPFSEDKLPFEESRFSGIMAKLKPNGSARTILNMSKGSPRAVNDGIDSSEYPTLMSSSEQFVRVLFRNGIGAEMTKTDWSSAYKQIRSGVNLCGYIYFFFWGGGGDLVLLLFIDLFMYFYFYGNHYISLFLWDIL